ncbi:MAG: hypothetical protein BTN85_0987 [Candidatus Methanohalarchaeum thermophilum]|uniref:Uncharacterized protein n=1 Tax=Methanohalarchaeum thermophilum TaxID=1903181 RepID=A0A1Q6DVX4_METT1|nr:MAG: hypothetical protein BTN85_0987 [Candidatus Methanohalarchaeum thermophilum]
MKFLETEEKKIEKEEEKEEWEDLNQQDPVENVYAQTAETRNPIPKENPAMKENAQTAEQKCKESEPTPMIE